eukprot:scaffold134823_cov23-Tisochrysis_lutea.AAC.1
MALNASLSLFAIKSRVLVVSAHCDQSPQEHNLAMAHLLVALQINPDDVVGQYGGDSLRLYEMFMGPLKETKVSPCCLAELPVAFVAVLFAAFLDGVASSARCLVLQQVWSTRGVEGVHRFLARAWRAFEGGISEDEPTKDQMRALHGCIKKLTLWNRWLRCIVAAEGLLTAPLLPGSFVVALSYIIKGCRSKNLHWYFGLHLGRRTRLTGHPFEHKLYHCTEQLMPQAYACADTTQADACAYTTQAYACASLCQTAYATSLCLRIIVPKSLCHKLMPALMPHKPMPVHHCT